MIVVFIVICDFINLVEAFVFILLEYLGFWLVIIVVMVYYWVHVDDE